MKKKRIFSILLFLVMVVGLMPSMAWASETVSHSNHCICGGGVTAGDHTTHTNITDWKKLSWNNSKLYVNDTELTAIEEGTEKYYSLESGNYYLADSFTIDKSIVVSAEKAVTLCLNGKILTSTVTGMSNGAIKAVGTFNLCDCGTSGTLKSKANGVYVDSVGTTQSTFNLYGGKIENDDTSNTSGVFMRYYQSPYPVFTMYGGTISGFKNSGVQVSDHGQFTMHDGTISGNSRSGNGGGVFVGTNATFAMNNGTISANQGSNGGGVYASGSFTMKNGKIENNTGYGGGVYINYNASVIMENGSISNNTGNDGGGVYIRGGSFAMSGGSITNNTATYSGGGIYHAGNHFTISSAAVISGNKKGTLTEGTDNNVNCRYEIITIGEGGLTGVARIGVNTAETPTSSKSIDITGENTKDYSAYFFADESSKYKIQNTSNNVVQLALGATEGAGSETGGETGGEVTPAQNYSYIDSSTGATFYASTLLEAFTKAKNGTTITVLNNDTTESAIYLGNDVSTTGALGEKTLTLDLYGKKLGTSDSSIQLLSSGAKLTITDADNGGEYAGMISSRGELKITNATVSNYVQILNGELTVNSGKLGLLIVAGGNVVLNGGTFRGAVIEDDGLSNGKGIMTDVTYENAEDAVNALKGFLASGKKYNMEIKTAEYTHEDTPYYAYLPAGVSVIDETHEHIWSTNWTTDATYHWHECTEGCDITEKSQKDGYGEHVYDNNQDTTCNTCGYTRTVSNFKRSHSYTPTYSITAPSTVEHGSVTIDSQYASKGRPVSISLEPEDGYTLNSLAITDENGQKLQVTDKGNGNYTFEMPAGNVNITASFALIKTGCYGKENCPSAKFSDLDTSLWYHEDTDYVLANGLMKGVSDKMFAPHENLTRAMLVTVLYRNEGEPATNKSIPFADIEHGAYYVNAVLWAQQNGIIEGISENEFLPNDSITREQMATIMYRYARYKGYNLDAGENTKLSSYDDFGNVSAYAITPMQYAVGSGIIKGSDDRKLNPKEPAERVEIAAILHRFIEANK